MGVVVTVNHNCAGASFRDNCKEIPVPLIRDSLRDAAPSKKLYLHAGNMKIELTE